MTLGDGHPQRMLTELEIRNIQTWVAAGGPKKVQGAFDSARRPVMRGPDLRDFGPRGAYDSTYWNKASGEDEMFPPRENSTARRAIPAPSVRRAYDTATEEFELSTGASDMAKMRFLAEKLDAKSWSQFRLALLGQDPEADETDEAEDDTEEHDRYLGEAQMREAKKRAAELAKAPAMDAARLAFDSQYPRAGRVKYVEYAPQEESAKPVTSAGLASFQAMFPGVSRVKRV